MEQQKRPKTNTDLLFVSHTIDGVASNLPKLTIGQTSCREDEGGGEDGVMPSE